MEEIQSLQTDLGKMKCGINSEKEQNKSLVMEQANIQEKLQTSREQNKRHCQELEALKEKVSKYVHLDLIVISMMLYLV